MTSGIPPGYFFNPIAIPEAVSCGWKGVNALPLRFLQIVKRNSKRLERCILELN
jgi:hypothetical protein